MQAVTNLLAGIGAVVTVGTVLWIALRAVEIDDLVVLTGTGGIIGAIVAVVMTILARRRKLATAGTPVAERQEVATYMPGPIANPVEATPSEAKDDLGFVTKTVAEIFGYLRWLSFPVLVASKWPNKPHKWSVRVAELYALSFFAVEIAALSGLFVWPWVSGYSALFLFAYLAFGYRLFDLWQYALNVAVFTNLRRRVRDGTILPVGAPERTLGLALVNFVEVILIFAVFASLNKEAFGLESTWSAVAYSVQVATLLGIDGIERLSGIAARVLFLSELGLAAMFIFLVLAATVSWLPRRN